MEIENVNIVRSDIIFKQINTEDFDPVIYDVRKECISPTPQGFISDQIEGIVNETFSEKETVIINAGVGQGKTHTIMKLAAQYYEANFVIVFAVPYKSLIDQYSQELNILGIRKELVLDYRDLENDNITPREASLLNIHLLTINAILGNPGDEYLQQSPRKIEYFNLTIDRCEIEGKKVVIIFDEIHDGIHNFKQKYIFNLWKWRNVVRKIFLVSATYNEASKVVIKYLAELTDDKILIIESERAKIEDKQSELFLLIYSKIKYDFNDQSFIELFNDLLSRDKKINILLYSRTLSEALIESKIGEILARKYEKKNINLCVGNSTNKFDTTKCNIGTTFSTGINIRGNDSAFIIFLPASKAYNDKKLGIFSSGINTLIQSLARVRDKSEVYIIMPQPTYLINFLFNRSNYINEVRKIDAFSDLAANNVYRDLNNQRELVDRKYIDIKSNVEDEIEYLTENRFRDSPTLNFPTLEDFILEDGEKVLRDTYDIFGKNFSIYTFWAAFNDQFLNCRLKNVALLSSLRIPEEMMFKMLYGLATEKYEPGYYIQMHLLSDKEMYEDFRSYFYSHSISVIGTERTYQLSKKRPLAQVERKILGVLQLLRKENADYFRRFYPNFLTWEEKGDLSESSDYKITDYFLACFSHAINGQGQLEDCTSQERELVMAYFQLANYYLQFKTRYILLDDLNTEYFPVQLNTNNSLTSDEVTILFNAVKYIRAYDPRVQKKVFSFLQNIENTNLNEPSIFLNKLYIAFRGAFFQCKREVIVVNNIKYRTLLVLDKQLDIPDHHNVLNLLYNPRHTWFE